MFENSRRKLARRKGIDYLRMGVAGQILGAIVLSCSMDDAAGLRLLGELTLVLATGVLVAGCGIYARYHGRGSGWGLLGFLNLLGVGLLVGICDLRRARQRGFALMREEPYRRDVWRMDVRVKLEAKVGAGASEPIMLQLVRGANVGMAMKMLMEVIPGLDEQGKNGMRFMVNGQESGRQGELGHGDELIVFLPEEKRAGVAASVGLERSP